MVLRQSHLTFLLCCGVTLITKVNAQDGPTENDRSSWIIRIAILSTSICFALPAIFIYWRHSSVKLPKFRAVLTLIAALIVRDIFTLASAVLLFTSGTDDLTCTILMTVGIFLGTVVYCCLLLEAIFVHRLLTSVFITHKYSEPTMWYFYVMAALIALGSTLAWYLKKGQLTSFECVLLIEHEKLHWIHNGTRAGLLLLNAILMFHIIVTLWKTFRYRPSVQHVAIRTGLANMCTIPFFLIHLLLVIAYPADWPMVNLFNIFLYALEGLQTMSVTLLHFYTDQPVLKTLSDYRRRVCKFCCHGQQSNFVLDAGNPLSNRETWMTILEDEYIVGLELPKELPSPTVKFYEDPVDRGQSYYVSMTSLHEEVETIEGKELAKNSDSETPNVIRNDSGFWYYKNRNVYLQEIEKVE